MTTPVLVLFLLHAMQTWSPESKHAYHERPAETHARYVSIAQDIVDVAMNPYTIPIFAGEDGREKTATLLLSIASFESGGFDMDVDLCTRGGDGGHAWSIFQIHEQFITDSRNPSFPGFPGSSRQEVCDSRPHAIQIALEMVRNSFKVCHSANVLDRLDAYTDGPGGLDENGQCKADWSRSRVRMKRAIHAWETK